ncbi:MAG: hypothetical protein ACOY33_09365 [Pseudomonadota bacterium]
MSRYAFFIVPALVAFPLVAYGECTLSHEECRDVYTCIEYYPNGTDCKKTVKSRECHTVCDEFDVDRGGIDDANRNVQQNPTGNGEDSKGSE